MPLSIAETAAVVEPSILDRLVDAPSAESARIDPAELAVSDNLPPQLLVHPELTSGAVLVCPHCEATVHVQMTAVRLQFPRPQSAATPDADG